MVRLAAPAIDAVVRGMQGVAGKAAIVSPEYDSGATTSLHTSPWLVAAAAHCASVAARSPRAPLGALQPAKIRTDDAGAAQAIDWASPCTSACTAPVLTAGQPLVCALANAVARRHARAERCVGNDASA